MIVERKSFLECIELSLEFPVLGIVGPRQVGKTYLAKLLQSKLKKESIYLDLELDTDLRKLNDPQYFLEQYEDKTVILDEVQHVPTLYPLLRALVDQNRVPGRFILLGSASPELIRDVSESLAGRIAYVEIAPLSLTEIDRSISLNDLWLRGGFPLAILAETNSAATNWMQFFVRSYIERDIPLLGLKVSPVQIDRLWRMLAHLNGQVLNVASLANSLGIASNTAKRYVDFMENAYLIRRVYPLWSNLKKRIVKSPKIFIRDTGVLHHLIHVKSYEELLSHPAAGHSWETFVINQIAANLPRGLDMYFYRTHNGAELDLVLVRGLENLVAIEIKLSNAPSLSRGNTVAFDDINARMNFILTPGSDDFLSKRNLRICSLKTFLIKYLPEV